MMYKRFLFLLVALAIVAGLPACNLFSPAAPTPFKGNATPDLTLTAIFSPVAPTPTLAPLVQTATAVNSETSTPTQKPSDTVAPTQTSLPATATNTVVPTQKPLIPTATKTATATKPAPKPTNTVPAATATPPSKRSNVTVEAIKLNPVPKKIDGDLSDWFLSHNYAENLVFGKRDSKLDLNSAYMVGWDGNYLYLGVFVRDDKYVELATGKNIFKGDSLEILFDVKLRSDFYSKELTGDDFQLGISPGNPTAGNKPEAYLWYPSGERGSVTDVKIGAVNTDKGYNVEVAIPWSLFDVKPKEGQTYGFCFSVSDDDSPSSATQEGMVSNCKNRKLDDPTTWGNLTLVTP